MKNLIILALLVFVLLLSVQATAAEKTCADNPLLPFLKEFIEEQNLFVDEEELIEYFTEEYSDDEGDVYPPGEFSGDHGDWPYFDGEWPYLDGEWPYFDGEWPYFDGEWPYLDGEWPYLDGEWPYFDGEYPYLDGEWPYLDGEWPYFDGEWYDDYYLFDGGFWEQDGDYWRTLDGEGWMHYFDGEWSGWDGEHWIDFDGEFPDMPYFSEFEVEESERPYRPPKTRPSRPKNQVPKNAKQQARFEKKERQQRKKKEIRKQLQQEILKQKFDIEDIIAIENNTPSVVNGLSMCKSLNGQESCCNQDDIHKFKKLTKGYFFRKMKEQPAASEIFDLIEEYSWQLSTDDCDIEDLIYEIEENEAVQAAYQKERQCQKQAYLITNNLIRGTICQVCMSPSNYETYFAGEGDNLQIKIHPNDMQRYREEMTTQMQCGQEAFQQYKEAAKSVVENYLNTQSCSSDVLDEILQIAGIVEIIEEELVTCSVDPGFFDDGCLADFTDSIGEEEVQETGFRRILNGSGAYLEDPSGISGAYEENPEEEAELQSLPDSTATPLAEEEPVQEPTPAPEQPVVDPTLSGSIIGTSLLVIVGLLFLSI